MRHFIFARPVPARPLGMFDPTATARLVTSPRSMQRPATSMRRSIGAVDVAPIAIAADQHLSPAGCVRAEKKPGLRHIIMVAATIVMRPTAAWTRAAVAAILPLQSCPARCEARRRSKTCR